jgi:hypothetical protein
MGLTTKEKRSAIKVTAPRYQKVIILDEFITLKGYERVCAAYVLRMHDRKVRISKNRVLVADIAIWYIMDYISG